MNHFVKVVKTEPENECTCVFETNDEIEENKEVNEITLQYMMNRELYENYILSQNETTKEYVMEERKFYRNRIFQLTKVLLLSEKERIRYFEMNPDFDITKIQFDVFLTFDVFVKNSIQNFKMMDTTDFLQEEYPKLEIENIKECGDYVETMEFESISEKSTLDNFVKIEKQEKEIVLPLQKNIDLKNPIFRKKGLRKIITV
jgi:hypothetical protein